MITSLNNGQSRFYAVTGDQDESFILTGGYTWNADLMPNGVLEGRPLITRTEIDPKESPYAMKWAKTYDLGGLEETSYAI